MTIETIQYKNHTIEIWQDDCYVNPYEDWDMLGSLSHWHRNGFIGDDVSNWESHEIEQHFDDIKRKGGIVLPVYMYEHSGQTISTTPFNCSWDSGQVGFIALEAHEIRAEYNVKRISKKLRERATKCLENNIETIDQWLRGEVYGFSTLDNKGNIIDSCGGFYGDYEGQCLDEAKSCVDYEIKKQRKAHFEQLKTFIKNRVPLSIRQNELNTI